MRARKRRPLETALLARLRGLVTSFRELTTGLRMMLDIAEVPTELSERLLLDQATDFSYIIGAMALLGLNTLAMLFLDFLNTPKAGLRDAILLAMALCYLATMQNGRGWLKRVRPSGRAAANYISSMVRLLALLGVLWSILICLLVEHQTPAQLCLLYGVMVGCLATPVVISPLSCAVAFWIPLSAGICAAQFDNKSIDMFGLSELFGFIALTGFCILYLNRRMIERAIGAIRLEENGEVIKLLLRDFEESASDWLWETNANLELQHVSQRLAQVSRRPAETIRGPFPQALLGEIMDYDHRAGSAIDKLQRAVRERSPFRDLVVPVIIEGEERYWSLTGKPIFDKFGRFSGYHGVGSDITGQKRQQEQIAFLARHDSLTKLPNRLLFNEVLHQSCANCETTGVALLCLDLDNFKMVNDTLGHATGDGLLVAVAERLRGCIRDFDIAARLGGDEFAIIMATEDVEEAGQVAARIVERVMRPYHFDGQLVQVGISIGMSMAPRDGKNPSGLMKNADLALYRAKSEGRGIWRMYDPEMDERLQEQRALQAALRQAVLRGEFRLDYQPIVEFASKRIVGAEALIRWQHPERGIMSPGEFIPMAEESGLIAQIGEWALNQACADAAGWAQEVRVAVNLSPLQFRDPGLVDIIDRAMAAAGLPPDRLELEITETTVLETNSQTVDALWQLHGRGVRIALDDFGTGYSSLSYLRRFPFHKIKIDRSFIRDLGFEADDSSIILAIIGLAERMNMVVTAEGVETPEQAALLTSYGCPQAQGFLFHKPMPNARFAQLLASGEALFEWEAAAQ